MPRIEWDESFSVNNPEIDAQHKKWIAIFNELHDHMIAGNDANLGSSAGRAVQEMYDYTGKHFHFEEAYMDKINYPGLLEHHRLHKNFDSEIYSYFRDLREGRIVLTSSIISMIRNWLLDHILQEDQKYKLFLDQRE